MPGLTHTAPRFIFGRESRELNDRSCGHPCPAVNKCRDALSVANAGRVTMRERLPRGCPDVRMNLPDLRLVELFEAGHPVLEQCSFMQHLPQPLAAQCETGFAQIRSGSP